MTLEQALARIAFLEDLERSTYRRWEYAEDELNDLRAEHPHCSRCGVWLICTESQESHTA